MPIYYLFIPWQLSYVSIKQDSNCLFDFVSSRFCVNYKITNYPQSALSRQMLFIFPFTFIQHFIIHQRICKRACVCVFFPSCNTWKTYVILTLIRYSIKLSTNRWRYCCFYFMYNFIFCRYAFVPCLYI